MYSNVAEVLCGFDLDSCCVAYTAKGSDQQPHVWALPRAQRALTLRDNVADPERQSLTYESRLIKYAQRGFAVAVPGFSAARVSGALFARQPSEVQGLARLLLSGLRLPVRPHHPSYHRFHRSLTKTKERKRKGGDATAGTMEQNCNSQTAQAYVVDGY